MMKTNLKRTFSLVAILTFIVSMNIMCKSDNVEEVVLVPDEPKPTAAFVATAPDPVKYKEYSFTNSSTNYTQFLWQFGDDATSTEVNPKHVYKFAGKYMVSLTTRNSQGYSAKKEILLNVVDPSFDATKYGENYMVTVGGKFSVNLEAGPGADSGEGSKKLVDQNNTTKFLQAGFDGTQRCTFEFNTPVVVGAYTLVSANDQPNWDPKSWVLQASTDGIQYRDLHTVTSPPWGTDGASRRVSKLYHFDNETAYKYYRLHIKQVRSGTVFHLSEWTLNKKQP